MTAKAPTSLPRKRGRPPKSAKETPISGITFEQFYRNVAVDILRAKAAKTNEELAALPDMFVLAGAMGLGKTSAIFRIAFELARCVPAVPSGNEMQRWSKWLVVMGTIEKARTVANDMVMRAVLGAHAAFTGKTFKLGKQDTVGRVNLRLPDGTMLLIEVELAGARSKLSSLNYSTVLLPEIQETPQDLIEYTATRSGRFVNPDVNDNATIRINIPGGEDIELSGSSKIGFTLADINWEEPSHPSNINLFGEKPRVTSKTIYMPQPIRFVEGELPADTPEGLHVAGTLWNKDGFFVPNMDAVHLTKYHADPKIPNSGFWYWLRRAKTYSQNKEYGKIERWLFGIQQTRKSANGYYRRFDPQKNVVSLDGEYISGRHLVIAYDPGVNAAWIAGFINEEQKLVIFMEWMFSSASGWSPTEQLAQYVYPAIAATQPTSVAIVLDPAGAALGKSRMQEGGGISVYASIRRFFSENEREFGAPVEVVFSPLSNTQIAKRLGAPNFFLPDKLKIDKGCYNLIAGLDGDYIVGMDDVGEEKLVKSQKISHLMEAFQYLCWNEWDKRERAKEDQYTCSIFHRR